ncbi:aspartic peptidase domain-containing protein [Cladorrhinum sp. PSN259]|nr:aspartic peptidase domain-containing protein [Cladorrhinum sp. PSN259]
MNFLFLSAAVMLQAVFISAVPSIINPLTGSKRLGLSDSYSSHPVEIINPLSSTARPGSSHLNKRATSGLVSWATQIINPLSASRRPGPSLESLLGQEHATRGVFNPRNGSHRSDPWRLSGLGPFSKSADKPLLLPLTPWTPGITTLQWSGEVTVGTPPQKFNVILDTGSPLPLVLPSSSCTSCSSPPSLLPFKTHDLFNPSLSTTFSGLPVTIPPLNFSGTGGGTVPYRTPQGANCTAVSDTVTIAGRSIPNQEFLLCDYYSEAFVDQFPDGILGLGSTPSEQWPSGGEYELLLKGLGVKQFALNLKEGVVKFGDVDLSENMKGAASEEGVRKVGLERELSSGTGTWVVNVTWEGQPDTKAVALLDTGAAIVSTPDVETARQLYARMDAGFRQIDELGSWGVECEVMERVKRDVRFVLGNGVEVLVMKEFINVGEYPGLPGICQGVFLNPLTRAREPINGRPAWVLGSPALRSYLTVWNVEELTVGFGGLNVGKKGGKRCGKRGGRNGGGRMKLDFIQN